jgi:hypothetical protein
MFAEMYPRSPGGFEKKHICTCNPINVYVGKKSAQDQATGENSVRYKCIRFWAEILERVLPLSVPLPVCK